MGGDFYDRPVHSAGPNAHSSKAQAALAQSGGLHKTLDPQQWNTYLKMTCDSRNPIIFALDVTGSMGDWSKVRELFISSDHLR